MDSDFALKRVKTPLTLTNLLWFLGDKRHTMPTNQNYSNLFEDYKSQFKKETGLEWNAHPEMYIQYVQAKCQVITMQMITDIRNYMSAIKESTSAMQFSLQQPPPRG